jgi:hypothetical protein
MVAEPPAGTVTDRLGTAWSGAAAADLPPEVRALKPATRDRTTMRAVMRNWVESCRDLDKVDS